MEEERQFAALVAELSAYRQAGHTCMHTLNVRDIDILLAGINRRFLPPDGIGDPQVRRLKVVEEEAIDHYWEISLASAALLFPSAKVGDILTLRSPTTPSYRA